ncbi:MAG: peptidylprolyl isomerase [Bacteroidetes bacterium]|nr:peptidylprolyl isomerase [Bacteroidota bacterium]
MPAIIIFLVIAFILTIVFEWGMDYLGITQPKYDSVGKVNGKKIDYTEFVELVKQRSENQKAQSGKEPDENQLVQIREEVWNSLVTQLLIDEEIAKMGIEVPDQEIVDWVHGENPPEFLTRQFMDSLGNFNRAAYESAISDPRNKEIWVQVEAGLRKQRMQEKLQSVLLAGVRVSDSEVLQRFADQNLKFNIDYVLFDPNQFIKDEETNVTDSDIEKYYNEHSTEFKVEATRKLKYVRFIEAPSAKDTQSVISEMEDILHRAQAGADFKDLANTYSETPASDVFFKPGELSPIKEEQLFAAKVGSIVGPVKDQDGYHLIKILEEKTGTDEFIRASHILISTQGADSVKALAEAKNILARIRKGENFAELAKLHSQDPGSGAKGGDLGWFGKGRMVKPFEDASYKTGINQIVGPIRTQFGYHIIKVTGKTKSEIKIAPISMPVKASSQTRNEIYQNAQDFEFLAKENDFVKEAEIAKYEVLETLPFTEKGTIPGIGLHRSINRFAFEEKVGAISEVLPITEGYAVFIITEAKKEGIRPLSELEETLRPRVLREKKMQLLKAKVEEFRKQIPDKEDLRTLGAKHPEWIISTSGPFTPAGGIPGIGRDLMLIGSVQALNVGDISKPIEGMRGYYIVKMLEKNTIDSTAYNTQKEMLVTQILQGKKSQFLSDWLEQLKKKADIEDNRDIFFR